MQYKFPKDFYWGAAVSGPQSEGAWDVDGKSKHIYDQFYINQPDRFYNGVGPQHTSNFYYEYKEYISLIKEVGLNSFRTSIQWSRLIPEGKGAVNQKAVTFYNNVIDELLANGITPFICLHHFDMPMVMQEIGGFENPEVTNHFADYAEQCFKLFGDKVKHWFTFNEPIVPVEGAYLYDFMYPNVRDFKRAINVAHNTNVAHAKAVERFNAVAKGGDIGTILNLTPSYPRSDNEQDIKASKLADAMFNKSFLYPAILGKYPEELIEFLDSNNLLPESSAEDSQAIKNSRITLLGVNYYQPRRIQAPTYAKHPDSPLMPEHFVSYYDMPGKKINPHRGWEIYEPGVYDILIDIKENLGNIKCFISENGMGVMDEQRFKDESGVIQDDYRIDFIKGHLKHVHKAIEEGVNVCGYHIWAAFDNWSWMNAYKNRYGYIEVDLDNNFKKTIKKSGRWMNQVVKDNGFTA